MMVSILGDSISTYEGFNPEGYAVFYDKRVQLLNGLDSVYDTWWAKVNQSLKAYLCVNNSYSGSTVSGVEFPSAGSDVRCSGLHTPLHQPDLILIYLGFNDFGRGVRVFRKGAFVKKRRWALSSAYHSFFDNDNPATRRNQAVFYKTKKDPSVFCDAYACMLEKLQTNYPHADIVCGTLVKTAMKDSDWVFPERFSGVPFDEYNDAIRIACEKAGCRLADMDKLNTRLETLDGSHPTAQGHALFAQEWIVSLEKLGMI